MNAFVKKEIRLLLPSWIVVLVLAALVPWLAWKDPDTSFAWTPLFVFLGVMLLAVDSFGREFSLGTFSSLMAQPMERRQIWRTKITILFSAAALIFAAYFISSEWVFRRALKILIWSADPQILGNDFWNAMAGSVAAILIALVGGLWTTLLIRQIAAAFWITFLVPMGLLMLVIFFLPVEIASRDYVVIPLLYSLAAIYCVAGFWFAHRLFHRAQDAAWTGGVISFSKWRYFESGANNLISVRRQKPFSALWKKEFQLHSISLFCAGALLVLHVAVFFLRAFYSNFHKNSLADIVSEFFWVFWLVMPLIIGCMAVAEERKLGVMESQFCLPVSRRRQFLIKFIPVMIFGVLLGGVVPLVLEGLAARCGVPNDYFKPESHEGNLIFSSIVWFHVGVIALSAGFALIGFLASTLARNFMQALSIAIVGCVVCFFFDKLFIGGNEQLTFLGMKFWGIAAPILIGILTILVFIPWLAAHNFSRYAESGRLWRRTVFGLAGALAFVLASSALIYNRVWEMVEPAEPAHGAAKFNLANPPKLQGDFYNSLHVRFPDGRVWCDNLKSSWDYEPNPWKRLWQALIHPSPVSDGPEQFLADSNWVSAKPGRRVGFWNDGARVTGYLDSVGIQTNGTLWISREAKPFAWTGAKMAQFGGETNWRQVVSVYGRYFLLLKTDGTLWQWRTKSDGYAWNGWRTNWPTVRNFQPQPAGTNSDWREIIQTSFGFSDAQKTDGSVWMVDFENETNAVRFIRETNLDSIVPQTLSQSLGGNSGYARTAYIGKGGTLWIRNIHLNDSNEMTDQLPAVAFLPVGTETNWAAVAIAWNRMVALKTDGTLWQWKLDTKTAAEAIQMPPTRLGIHDDWVGVASIWDGETVSLAADGSLWFWPGTEYDGALLKASRQPKLIANVFGGEN